METREASDRDLLERAGAGCEESFTAIYRRHQARLYRFAYAMTGSTALAEEATQEVFLALLRRAHRFDAGRGELFPYLLGMARRQVYRLLRRERGASAAAQPEQPENAAVLDELIRHEDTGRVRLAVLALPVKYREVITLCELEELNYEAAAAALDCPVGTVRSRLHRARRMLAEKLGGVERRSSVFGRLLRRWA
jgi:RNA polymerase sigma-70 factor (ECF subfamily)